MNGQNQDSIAIDTNVFEHLLYSEMNVDGHITKLLSQLIESNIRLLVDDKGRIRGEYYERFCSRSQKKSLGEGKAERILLKHWFSIENQKVVDIKPQDALMRAIRSIIRPEAQKRVTDGFFVYVAFKIGKVLVTNDHNDIVNRKAALKRKTKRFCQEGADIMSSQEAYNNLKVCQQEY